MNLQSETEFFHDIAFKVRDLVSSFNGNASVAKHKEITGDYATEVDIAVEVLIVNEIQKRFPGDAILAEEGHSDVKIPDGRIWIIDPICGTTNLGRGLKTFCTNIALADHKQLIAACVVDHSQNDYFWSVGNKEIYINNQLYTRVETDKNFGTVIDIDFGALGNVSEALKKKHAEAAFKLTLEDGYMLQSLSSSLGFAYTSVGKVDGFINAYNHPWDICASSFLIQQSGGIITNLEGNEWDVETVGAIGSSTAAVHQKLLEVYLSSNA